MTVEIDFDDIEEVDDIEEAFIEKEEKEAQERAEFFKPNNVKTFGVCMSNDDYHAHPALGSSNIKQLLKNPYVYYAKVAQKETKAKDFGSCGHKLILEPHDFFNEFAIMPEVNARTNDGKNLKAMFEMDNKGKTIIKSIDHENAQKCVNQIMDVARVFFECEGVNERAFFGEINGVKVKCKPDRYIESMGLIIDVKFVDDASPDGFAKAAAKYGYYIQDPLYRNVVAQNGYDANRFIFIAVEKEAPFMVGIYELDHVATDFGKSEILRALDIYSRLDDYKKPVYKDTTDGSTVQTLTLPNWVYYAKGASL